MPRFLKLFVTCGVLAVSAWTVSAFSLRGPTNSSWMTPRLGYNVNNNPLFGPMQTGEEYRWNVPTIYYAYTPDFLNYFGQRGIDEIEKAVKILNDLPPADQINIDDYPLSSQRINYRAQALQLLDVKSYALSLLLGDIGLADPTRFVFTLRNRWVDPAPGGPTNYYIIKRNFDPVDWRYTSFINGQLWTYNTIFEGTISFAPTEPVDPLALNGLINTPVTSGGFSSHLLLGGYWTTLTRDDVAGIKYIYRTSNFNVENPPTNSFSTAFGAVAVGGVSSPWAIPGPVTPGTGGGIPGTSTNFISTGLRPGINKLTFQRAFYQNGLGFFLSNNVAFADNVIGPNGGLVQQSLVRAQVIPDFLFDGADLQGADDNGVVPNQHPAYQEATVTWINNDAINGQAGQLGPGEIPISSIVMTFNTVGPTIWNSYPIPSGFLSETEFVFRYPIWGSFDGSTNAPAIYPFRTTIEEVERRSLGLGGTGTDVGAPTVSLIEPWTVPLPIQTNTATAGAGTGTTTP